MPLQIKELYVKVTVSADEEQGSSEQGANTASESSGDSVMNKDEIIAECVEQVIEILKEKMEP
ncbi:DUF5908 family protein [Aquimarina algiphila]|uniref:DUF5908 family protein n=1 Tax=Aquimarina algiphila TaxID=2047982 RepID=UPI00249145C6|nr:DUF5908 family protein [Aquimarina algiphila]